MRIKNDDDIENVILRYLDWREYPVYAYCKCCGKEIKISGNRKKYCSKCAKEIEKRNVNNRVRKHRNENVTK